MIAVGALFPFNDALLSLPHAEIDSLYQRRKTLQDEFRREQSLYLEATREERAAEKAAREEESAKRREDRQARRRKSQ